MRKLLAALVLTGLLLFGGGLLAQSSDGNGCPGSCCTGPEDCPRPTCCVKR